MPAVPYTPRVKLRTSSRRLVRPRGADGEGSTVPDSEPNMRLSRAILVMLLLHVVAIGGILAFSLIKERGQNGATAASSAAPVEAEVSNIPAHSAAAASSPAMRDNPTPHPGIHIVRPGETLMLIANENNVPLAALVAANGGNRSGDLHAGQEIRLPDKTTPESAPPSRVTDALDRIEGTGPSPAANSAPPHKTSAASGTPAAGHIAPAPIDSGKTYVVSKGDSVESIARKLKVDTDTLLKLNRITDPKSIKPGQKLRLPAPPAHGK